jgi:outer membrane protein OmpA-like peptidoglycan-associated protein
MNCKYQIIFLTAVFSFVTGCTTDPYTGEQTISKAGIGAGIGAASGAIIGGIAGKGTGALIGAGVGAAVGGIAGGMMDRQADALRQQLRSTGVGVAQDPQTKDIRLIMPGDITFATNRADIRPEFYQVLNSVTLVLIKYNQTLIRIDGFTDSTGTADYNQVLSERRANAVSQYLSSQGVNPNRIVTRGFGQRQPVANNATAEGRSQNRRVEITIHAVG